MITTNINEKLRLCLTKHINGTPNIPEWFKYEAKKLCCRQTDLVGEMLGNLELIYLRGKQEIEEADDAYCSMQEQNKKSR